VNGPLCPGRCPCALACFTGAVQFDGWGDESLRARQIARRIIPRPVRALGSDAYYRFREQRPQAIVGYRTRRRILALTFDDSPNPAVTRELLDLLDTYGARATFFLVGRKVVAHPDIAREIVRRGHAVGNHTFSHPHLPSCGLRAICWELARCQRAVREATGVRPALMRPPFGYQDMASFLIARLLGYTVVHWSVSGDDWQGDPAPVVAGRARAGVKAGSIILLHDGWEPPLDATEWRQEHELLQDRSPTLEALPMVLGPLRDQGYQWVTLPEMMREGRPVREPWPE